MAWGNLKKGDKALKVYCFGERQEAIYTVMVKSVGPRWITVINPRGHNPTKFDAEYGFGEFGFSLHTEETLARAREGGVLIRRISQVFWEAVPLENLRKIMSLVRRE